MWDNYPSHDVKVYQLSNLFRWMKVLGNFYEYHVQYLNFYMLTLLKTILLLVYWGGSLGNNVAKIVQLQVHAYSFDFSRWSPSTSWPTIHINLFLYIQWIICSRWVSPLVEGVGFNSRGLIMGQIMHACFMY